MIKSTVCLSGERKQDPCVREHGDQRQSPKFFTLIELLIAIAIIAILHPNI